MPIYEYKCKKCGHLFELLEVSYNNVSGKTCVKCGSQAERIISLSSFQLKGSGWYKTDYASNQSCGANKSSSTTCESCPAATSETKQ